MKRNILLYILLLLLIFGSTTFAKDKQDSNLVDDIDKIKSILKDEGLSMIEVPLDSELSLDVKEKAYLTNDDKIYIYVFPSTEEVQVGMKEIKDRNENLDLPLHYYQAENVLLVYRTKIEEEKVKSAIKFTLDYINQIYEGSKVDDDSENGNILGTALFIAFISMGIYLKWSDMKYWKTVYESSTLKSEAHRRFAYLKQNGIKCRLKTLTPRGATTQGGSPVMGSTSRVEVHKNDLSRALRLLNDLEEQE